MQHEDALQAVARRLGRRLNEVQELWALRAHEPDLYEVLLEVIGRLDANAVDQVRRVTDPPMLWRLQGQLAAYDLVRFALNECYVAVEAAQEKNDG